MSLPDQLLSDVLACLRQIADMDSGQAKESLNALRAKQPDVPMRLVWEQDPFGGTFHYDMLITVEGGTVSLAFAPDRALPWPLRGSRHTGEQVLLRVNGTEVTMEQAVSMLDVLWSDTALATRLVNASLVEQELARFPIEPTAAELQEVLDAFRRARGLLTVQDTREWMAERGLSHARLEEIAASEAAVAGLRRRVVGDDVEEAFASRPGGYDRLSVLELRYSDPGAARAAAVRLGAPDRPGGGTDPLALAARETLDHGAHGQVRQVRRRELGPAAVSARAGDLLGPGEHDTAVHRVLEVRPAVLDGPTRREIEEMLFGLWLADRRREAELEWFWGTAPRTRALTEALRRPVSAAFEVAAATVDADADRPRGDAGGMDPSPAADK
ncbi:TIGR04500 family putative peptide maturation system protein [Planomonospora parontospora]|uniref:TIGR04500 family putative peptide maturation system protein n=1 Tax=Planomonospora parontospora TaxID=58119 RepID=UPI00166FD265|nr:TIGR04500 family putative peptide maturation system protein [Planomonospora parontospora]GGL29210.1 hypothetical protein GCM10014719_33380 [Planomonospora parontospora subsp. antibiotica]GII19745.1 hypothetical protein Ppa05_64710 [Planomonospora parontospora subsp. antibiotica]